VDFGDENELAKKTTSSSACSVLRNSHCAAVVFFCVSFSFQKKYKRFHRTRQLTFTGNGSDLP